MSTNFQIPHPVESIEKSLLQWNEALATHFGEIALRRKSVSLGVFAFEHSLTPDELNVIFPKLVREITDSGINRKYWLLWVVYATELGYDYDGEEYWQSFYEKTPLWNDLFREDIRWAFDEFCRKYNGIRPEGKWANHFSIIAYPITHSILPKDLQSQLARSIYSVRRKLTNLVAWEEKYVGHIIASDLSSINSKRYQHFLEQDELVGRIVCALLDGSPSEGNSQNLIFPPALKRIVADLEKSKSSKQWIKNAIQTVGTRIIGTTSNEPHKKVNSLTQEHVERVSIRPRLSLSRTGIDSWNVILEIPNISPAFEADGLKHFVNNRFKIEAAKTNWLLTDILLTSQFKRRILRWPEKGALIKLETPDSVLSNSLDSECSLSDKFPLVFRVGVNGIAVEIVGKVVRPGLQYVLIFKDDYDRSNNELKNCHIECEGIKGQILEVPTILSEQTIQLYQGFGLTIQKSIKVWPIGMPARGWDGQGFSEWLTTESPCFAIQHDHEIEKYIVSVGDVSIDVIPKGPGQACYVKLQALSQGRHQLLIHAVASDGGNGDVEGAIILNVREPVTWSPKVALYNGLSISLDPVDDNLDNFLSGKTNITVLGPKERTVNVQFDFLAARSLLGTIGPRIYALPLGLTQLKGLLQESLRKEEIHDAGQMNLVINGHDLGKQSIALHRNIDPVRWGYRKRSNKGFVRLIDETDKPDQLKISFFSMNTPDVEQSISSKEIINLKEISTDKGLYLAKKNKYESSIVASHIDSSHSLEGLKISPKIARFSKDVVLSYSRCASNGKKWHKARSADYISQLHQQKVLSIFLNQLISYLCGSDWFDYEVNFYSNSDKFDLKLFCLKIGNRSIQELILHRILSKNGTRIRPDEERAWFLEAIVRCKVLPEKPLGSFALQIASNPLLEDEYFKGKFSENLILVANNRILMRAARCFVLSLSKVLNPDKVEVPIIPDGLKWH